MWGRHAVETTKSLPKKEKDPSKGLLAYRSIPLACGYSPSKLLMGRKFRNVIPTFHTNLNPSWPDMEKLCEREAESKKSKGITSVSDSMLCHWKHSNWVFLCMSKIQELLLQKPEQQKQTLRSYMIKTEKGTVRQNRSHISPIPTDKLVSPSVADKSASPSVSKQQNPRTRHWLLWSHSHRFVFCHDPRDSLGPLSS